MLASELIKELEEIVSKQGDSEIWIDVSERDSFCTNFDVIDRWYNGNSNYDNKRIFIVLGDDK